MPQSPILHPRLEHRIAALGLVGRHFFLDHVPMFSQFAVRDAEDVDDDGDHLPRKVRTFIDFLVEKFKDPPWSDEEPPGR